jgi:hypothetical protein
VISTGALLDTMRVQPQRREARARLDMSDAILRGDLIQKVVEARKSP